MDDNKIKELISEAFFKLLMAKNRYKVFYSGSGDDGVDLRIGDLTRYTRPNGKHSYIDGQHVLDIQLKCTTEKQIRRGKNGDFTFRVKIKNYEDLIVKRDLGGTIKMILVVFILPELEEDWMEILEDEIRLCKHAFWFQPGPEYTLENTAHSTDKHSYITISVSGKNRLALDFKTLFDTLYEISATN